MTENVISWSAKATATAIAQGKISSRQVVEAHLAWMARVNPKINAVTADLSEAALVAARRADQLQKSGARLGPLHGVPVTIKENVDQKGFSTPNGVEGLAHIIASEDSPVAKSLQDAGAIVIGRTNTPEFSFRFTTDNPYRGLTRNPWSDEITCGGSSGGAGAAVAAGIGCIAHGNDLAGSLRYPAYCNGVATIRPTLGRVAAYNPSQTAERPYLTQLTSVQGPIARHVSDVRLGLSVMAQRDPRDPLWVPAPLEGSAVERPIRVAWFRETYGLSADREVMQALEQASGILTDAGYMVEEVAPPRSLPTLLQLWFDIVFTEMKVLQEAGMRPLLSPGMGSLLDDYFSIANILDLRGYMSAICERQAALRDWCQFQERYPLSLSPVSLRKPVAPGADLLGRTAAKDIFESNLYLASINLLGLPAAVVPVARVGRVPIGVQIIGQRYREDLCLDAAEAIERSIGIMTDPLIEELMLHG